MATAIPIAVPIDALTFGPFSTKNCVQPHETEEYEALAGALWTELCPKEAVEQMMATEIIRCAWRLNRCAVVESELGRRTMENAFSCDPMLDEKTARIQTAVDRTRAQTQSALRRAMADLTALQTERWAQQETLVFGHVPTSIGLAALKPVLVTRTLYEKQLRPREDKTPDAGKPISVHDRICFCGSGSKLKNCCGDTQVHREPPQPRRR